MARAQHTVLTVTHSPPPDPGVEVPPKTVVLFKHSTRCLTYMFPGHPPQDVLYMALQTPGALPWELGPAIHTHLQEHFGRHTTLYPHRAPLVAPMYLQPRTEPGIRFHDLTPLATIRGAIVATNAGTTLVGMTMAVAYESAPGE